MLDKYKELKEAQKTKSRAQNDDARGGRQYSSKNARGAGAQGTGRRLTQSRLLRPRPHPPPCARGVAVARLGGGAPTRPRQRKHRRDGHSSAPRTCRSPSDTRPPKTIPEAAPPCPRTSRRRSRAGRGASRRTATRPRQCPATSRSHGVSVPGDVSRLTPRLTSYCYGAQRVGNVRQVVSRR